METITREYPELTEFFNSSEFKKSLGDCKLKVEYQGSDENGHIALFEIAIGTNGIQRALKINSYYINRNILTAQELKSLLCHELGHLNDKKLALKTAIFVSGFIVGSSALVVLLINSLFKQRWKSLLQNGCIGAGLLTLYYLLMARLARNGEYFADEYSTRLTKDKKSIISLLEKRKQIYKKECNQTILQKLFAWFDDHPTEEERIAYIESLSL